MTAGPEQNLPGGLYPDCGATLTALSWLEGGWSSELGLGKMPCLALIIPFAFNNQFLNSENKFESNVCKATKAFSSQNSLKSMVHSVWGAEDVWVWTDWSGLPQSKVKPGQEWCSPGYPTVLIFLFYPSILRSNNLFIILSLKDNYNSIPQKPFISLYLKMRSSIVACKNLLSSWEVLLKFITAGLRIILN